MVVVLLLYGSVRFLFSALLPAMQMLRGDFGALFPYRYLAESLRPDFPVHQVTGWEEGMWFYGPMFNFLSIPLFIAPSWSWVPRLWAIMNLSALGISFFWVYRLVVKKGEGNWRWFCALLGLWFLYQPLMDCFMQGNIEILEMALLVGSVSLLHRGREKGSGFLLGLATMTKYFPAGFLAWFFLRRRWRAACAGLLTVVAVAGVTAVTLRWDRSGSKGDFLPSVINPRISWTTISLTSVPAYWLGKVDWSKDLPELHLSDGRRRIALFLGRLATLVLSVFYAFLLMSRSGRPLSPYEAGILFLLIFLLIPYNHVHYYVFALIPLSILFLKALVSKNKPVLWITLLGYVLISPPIPYGLMDRTGWFPGPFIFVMTASGLPLVGVSILLLTLTALLMREKGSSPLCS